MTTPLPTSLIQLKAAQEVVRRVPREHLASFRMFGLDELVRDLERGVRASELGAKATGVLHEALLVRHAQARWAMLEALAAFPGLQCHSSVGILVMARAIDHQLDQELPVLWQAGFRLKDNGLDQELLASAIGRGAWPAPELLCPDLPRRPEAGVVMTSALSSLASAHADSERASCDKATVNIAHSMVRLAEWSQRIHAQTELGEAMTQGLASKVPGRAWLYLMTEAKPELEALLLQAMGLGLRLDPAMANLGKGIESLISISGLALLTEVHARHMEAITPQATGTARPQRI